METLGWVALIALTVAIVAVVVFYRKFCEAMDEAETPPCGTVQKKRGIWR